MSLGFSYRSNNPFGRAFYLIISLLFFSPVICSISYSWSVYLILIVFLRGVFVIVVYVCTIGSWINKRVRFSFFLLRFILFLTPLILPFIVRNTHVSLYFGGNYLFIMGFTVIFLGFCVLFISYMLQFNAAIRKF